MTPLAHSIAKQLLLRPKKRLPAIIAEGERKGREVPHSDLVTDIHCFECSAIFDLACELVDSGKALDLAAEADRVFLPAPRTWIEQKVSGRRSGWLLTETKNEPLLRAVFEMDDRFAVTEELLNDHGTQGLIIAMLALINTPRVIGREQFWPHRGLERDLRRSSPGKYPLHAWHALKLHVAKPPEIDDGEPHEAHLTGRRALHFCRAHLRIRFGQIEYVTSHWRGDAALGIKQTKYDVVA